MPICDQFITDYGFTPLYRVVNSSNRVFKTEFTSVLSFAFDSTTRILSYDGSFSNTISRVMKYEVLESEIPAAIEFNFV